MLIDRAGIARLIPHTGDMCLLDQVLAWDAARIRCATESHRTEHNPLRHNGRLGILSGVEYACQAMAVHGALTAEKEGTAKAGYLVSLRNTECHAPRLDLLPGLLIVEAELTHGDDHQAMYGFMLSGRDGILLTGRAVVLLSAIAP